jgi:PAS domain S-box-containing protein
MSDESALRKKKRPAKPSAARLDRVKNRQATQPIEIAGQLSILEGAPEAILSAGPDGTIVMANSAAERVFGYSRGEIIGRRLEVLLPRWSEFACGAESTEGSPRGSPENEHDLKGRRKDGTEFPVQVTLRTVASTEGTASIVFINDLTERKKAEEALHESDMRLALVREAAGIGIWDWKIESGKIRCTEQWSCLRGLPPEAVVVSRDEWLAMLHPDDRERVLTDLNRALEGVQPYETEFRVIWPDGTVHWLIGKGEVLQNSTGNPVSLLGSSLDITARRDAEEALRASEERLRALTASLYMAQEDERKRLARELHDDLSQRMAMVANEAELIEKELLSSVSRTSCSECDPYIPE